MNALQMATPVELDVGIRGLGLEPLDRRELTAVNGGAYFLAGCLIATGIGGVFVACAVVAASYYVFKHTW